MRVTLYLMSTVNETHNILAIQNTLKYVDLWENVVIVVDPRAAMLQSKGKFPDGGLLIINDTRLYDVFELVHFLDENGLRPL